MYNLKKQEICFVPVKNILGYEYRVSHDTESYYYEVPVSLGIFLLDRSES